MGAMCGIGAVISLRQQPVPHLQSALAGMRELLAHRGPDGEGEWLHPRRCVGLANRRLEIIDLEHGDQPMTDGEGNWITYNGEIYNYLELRRELGEREFRTDSDTEVILRAYRRLGARVPPSSPRHVRIRALGRRGGAAGRGAGSVRDQTAVHRGRGRDPVLRIGGEGHSPVPPEDRDGRSKGFATISPSSFRWREDTVRGDRGAAASARPRRRGWSRAAAALVAGALRARSRTSRRTHISRLLRETILGSVEQHLRADVPVGAYLSGGIDSSIVAAAASRSQGADGFVAFAGRFAEGPAYDETPFAQEVADAEGFELRVETVAPRRL